MNQFHIGWVGGCVSLALLALPTALQAQAFVNQATPPNGKSVYVDQVPSGAKPHISKPAPARSAARRAAPPIKASVVDEVVSAVRLVPTVGAGSSAIVRSATTREWPTVGEGTVRK